MSKYQPLGDYLQTQKSDSVPLSFDEIERLIGAPLPPKAQTQRAWWSNNASNNVMTKVWIDAGFRTEQVDLEARRLSFRRDAAGSPGKPWREGEPVPLVNGRHPIIGSMKGTITVMPGVDLTEPACPEWAEMAGNKTL